MFESKPSSAGVSSLAAPTESLAASFGNLWISDPVMTALWEGKMAWGDILCTPEEEERNRVLRAAREKEEAAARAEQDALLTEYTAREATHRKPRTDASLKPTVTVEREVPAFPAGRRTIMAKNLPRDINVQELRTIFEKYGAIRDIYIPKNMDKSSPYFGTIKGFAKIQFLKADDSASAFAAQYALLNIRGKNIALEPAAEDR
jgi:hypothetical protein